MCLGPDHWYETYPSCGHARQSPIDVKSNMAYYRPDLGNFVFDNYNADNLDMSLSNNGHSGMFSNQIVTNHKKLTTAAGSPPINY